MCDVTKLVELSIRFRNIISFRIKVSIFVKISSITNNQEGQSDDSLQTFWEKKNWKISERVLFHKKKKVNVEHSAINWISRLSLLCFQCVRSDRSRPSKTSLQAFDLSVQMWKVVKVLWSQSTVCGCAPLLNKSGGFYMCCKMEE